jgi:hypothetical protein
MLFLPLRVSLVENGEVQFLFLITSPPNHDQYCISGGGFKAAPSDSCMLHRRKVEHPQAPWRRGHHRRTLRLP